MTNFTSTLLKTSTNSTRELQDNEAATISLKKISDGQQQVLDIKEKDLSSQVYIHPVSTSTSPIMVNGGSLSSPPLSGALPIITTTTTTTTTTTITTTSCSSSISSSIPNSPTESSFMSFFNLYRMLSLQQQQPNNVTDIENGASSAASSAKSTATEKNMINLINYNNQYIPSGDLLKFVEKESLERKKGGTNPSVVKEEVTLSQRFKYFFIWLLHQIKNSTWKGWVKIGLVACFIVAICLAIFVFKVQEHLEILQEFVKKFGVGLGGLVFMGVFILLIVFLIPVTIPTILAGIIFKPYFGFLFVWGASIIGGNIAFFLGRYVFRKSIVKKIEKNKKLLIIDQVIGQQGWKIVLLLRFTPIIPESLLNYALAVTRISFRHYIICSAIGLIPGVSLFIYIGSMIGSISDIGKKQTKSEIAMYIVSGVVMIFTILFILIIVRRAVNKKLEQEENKGLLDEEEAGQEQENQPDIPNINEIESAVN
ncbi:hypothetical protein DLAC_05508 [Tieghemostelium lacteum]|uniref:VTT domain-containing protein n=1 Tax=Tieghemostelium lacteum TaxID=361077 RepID=A0A151ZG61_TIELA|nr:hypothetical protein DLAC_05508 [Tieghemostelium lacteum]|eukprot:KYQ92915.1 hypothetical protein DLAC_05508 [Tieghemostelium lacteum]